MPEAQVVSVEIRGQRYPIESDLDAKYVNGLASYLDEKMRAAAESTPHGGHASADRARRAEHRRRVVPVPGRATGSRGALTERTEALERLLDAALAP